MHTNKYLKPRQRKLESAKINDKYTIYICLEPVKYLRHFCGVRNEKVIYISYKDHSQVPSSSSPSPSSSSSSINSH